MGADIKDASDGHWPSAFEIENWVRDSAIDRAAEQISAGRKFRELAIDELSRKWLEVVEETIRLPDRAAPRLAERSLSAEFTARGTKPPYQLIEGRRGSIADSLATLLATMQRDDPHEFEELAAFVRNKIDDFRSQRGRS